MESNTQPHHTSHINIIIWWPTLSNIPHHIGTSGHRDQHSTTPHCMPLLYSGLHALRLLYSGLHALMLLYSGLHPLMLLYFGFHALMLLYSGLHALMLLYSGLHALMLLYSGLHALMLLCRNPTERKMQRLYLSLASIMGCVLLILWNNFCFADHQATEAQQVTRSAMSHFSSQLFYTHSCACLALQMKGKLVQNRYSYTGWGCQSSLFFIRPVSNRYRYVKLSRSFKKNIHPWSLFMILVSSVPLHREVTGCVWGDTKIQEETTTKEHKYYNHMLPF